MKEFRALDHCYEKRPEPMDILLENGAMPINLFIFPSKMTRGKVHPCTPFVCENTPPS